MSILGFSIVGISKMISISILGYSNPARALWGGGLGGQSGYIDVILILGFLIVGNFILGSPNLSKGTPWRWLGSEEV